MQPERELLRKWKARNRFGRLHPRLEITGDGLVLGAGTLLAKTPSGARGRPHLAVDEPRVMALLATAYGKPVAPHVLARLRRAAELWNDGEKALAHIHLAHADRPPCGEDETLRLLLAEECLSAGITPAELMKAQGFVPALLALLKYNPSQPRVSAGSGRESGEWTSGDGGGTGISAAPATAGLSSAPAAAGEGAKTLAADLFEGASPRFLAGLAGLGATIGGAGAVLGAIFVPSPNPGLSSEGAVPGDPGLRYAINQDEATLRLTRDGEVAVAAQRGQDGIFYEVETGAPMARDIGGSIVFDAATLASATASRRTSQASDRAVDAAAQTEAENETPKLCPDPGPDAPHGASERAQLYQQQISALNNPQRPLQAGQAVSLTNPVTGKRVVFDDCRESDGTMIEGKGPRFTKMMANNFMYDRISARWIKQATNQVEASGGRALEWYFAEAAAAAKADDIFAFYRTLKG
ncbi:MAG: hypothetical protein ACREDJ_04030, partial [Methylocella sp.]